MTRKEIFWTGRHLLSVLIRQRQLSAPMLSWRAWHRYWTALRQYKRLASGRDDRQNLYPCLGDDTAETAIEPTYFYQDAWAFDRIVVQRPAWHVDAGSHHKYVALLSKVLPVTMVDIRPLSVPMESIKFRRGSILELPFDDASMPSVSSLCVVEHIGLGRYGDPLDISGTEKSIAELKRVVHAGGDLYISLPLDDKNRVYFNAHRAFTEEYVLDLIQPFEVVQNRYIYNGEFGNERRSGFGVGCYHLRAPTR